MTYAAYLLFIEYMYIVHRYKHGSIMDSSTAYQAEDRGFKPGLPPLNYSNFVQNLI